MANFYLEFEKPLKDIDDRILSLTSMVDLNKDDITSLARLKEERSTLIAKIYSGLSRW